MNTILTLSIMLTISIAINILLFVYLRNVLSKLLFVSENLGDLEQMLVNFNNHLAAVYELETFYGDDTLHHLLEHVGDLSEQLQEFEDIFSLTNEENIEVEQDTAEQPAEKTPA
tara:strand:+ start:3890 stop:4231 length:342 start_codon:yes stop_codon:yes gene_type:complete